MRILYAAQGTGNGHLARATEIVPLLKELAHTDVLVSGIQADLELPFRVDYKLYGLSFIFGKKGGVDFVETLRRSRLFRFVSDLNRIPLHQYDLILCDFEPVTAWACRLRNKPCIGLSHQAAVLHPLAPRPKTNSWIGRFILKHYAPSSVKYGFHFRSLDASNYPPVIRPAIRQAIPEDNGHFTVYLPAYGNAEIEEALSAFPDIHWEVFSKHHKQTYRKGNIHFNPVSLEKFTESFIRCTGILCTAGFETPAEALFMGKKLCVIPMKNQYEQSCNAAFLAHMGIRTLPELKNQRHNLEDWLYHDPPLQIDYPDLTRSLLEEIIRRHRHSQPSAIRSAV